MSRQKRLDQYANPMRGPHGAGSAQENIDHWTARASENSKIAPRASDGPMKLPSTKVNTRDTSMKPYRARGDARADAKADKNDAGSSYMKSIRRNA